MKATNNLTMIYDDACPMCNIYTQAFTKNQWIGSRCGFSNVPDEVLRSLDLDRSKNEIPLYDEATHTTVYGIDALMKVLGQRFPVLKPLFSWVLFRFLVKKLYYLVSFNRRVIAGTRPATKGFDCTPDVNVKYRLLYIIIAVLSGTGLFYASGQLMFGFILVVAIVGSSLFHKKTLDYNGQLITIFLLTGVLSTLLYAWLPSYFVIGISIAFFIFFSVKRVIVLHHTYGEQGTFRVGFIITKMIIEICKLPLLISAKKYHTTKLPAWLEVPMADTDYVGKDFYTAFAKENNYETGTENTQGLCRLEDLTSADFDAGKVNKKIRHFYQHTHLYGFEVEQKWNGWVTGILRIFIKYYNSVSQQFNFNMIKAGEASQVENILTPIQTRQGEMMSWVRQNTSADTTMFAGFYQADHLPFDAGETCVTTRFPLRNVCMMVKLKPANEANGNFSFRSNDTRFGRHSFYVVMRYGQRYYITTLPIRELLKVYEKDGQLEVDHIFSFYHFPFMQFHYRVTENK